MEKADVDTHVEGGTPYVDEATLTDQVTIRLLVNAEPPEEATDD